jgi:two-component system cell cycle response regulator
MKVLIADDDPVSRRILASNLESWDYQVVQAADGDSAWKILAEEDAPRMVILDWMMPGMSGVSLCQRMRELQVDAHTYIILLTVRGEKQDMIYALNTGADDYLAKPFDADELEARLLAGKRVMKLQGQLLSTRKILQEQVSRDHLTGLLNRAAVLDVLDRELARESRDGIPLGLAMGDLDHFKLVNDNHGHLVGDDVLRSAAKSMLASVRPYDSLGRYGGEEFLVILPGCSVNQANLVANRMRQNVVECTEWPSACQEPVTISLGVTSTQGVATKTPESLIEAADRALYRAKDKGRNRVETGA